MWVLFTEKHLTYNTRLFILLFTPPPTSPFFCLADPHGQLCRRVREARGQDEAVCGLRQTRVPVPHGKENGCCAVGRKKTNGLSVRKELLRDKSSLCRRKENGVLLANRSAAVPVNAQVQDLH